MSWLWIAWLVGVPLIAMISYFWSFMRKRPPKT